MPNCFSLTRKGEDKPTPLATIDDEICKHLNVEPHPTDYVHSWYDYIGLSLALGHDFNKTKEIFKDSPSLIEIINFLELNYTSDAWYEHK